MAKKSLLNPDDFITTKETPQQTTPAPEPERRAEPVYRNMQAEPIRQNVPQYQQPIPQYAASYEEEQPVRRGRKPKEEKNAREFLSIDLGGQKRNLKILCFDLEQRTGETWSLNRYIKELIDADIKSKQNVIDLYRNR